MPVEARNLKMNEFDTSKKPSLRQKKTTNKVQHMQSSGLYPDRNSNANNQNKKISTVRFEKKRDNLKKTSSLHTKSIIKKSNIDLWLEQSSEEEPDGDGPPEKINYDHKLQAIELSTDHWIVQKMFKYIRNGSRSATLFALCSLSELSLNTDAVSCSVRDIGGLDMLVNLLECKDTACQIGSMKTLNLLAESRITRLTVIELGATELLLNLLYNLNEEVVGQAADLLGRIATTSSARRIVRSQEGIKKLVTLLDIPSSFTGFVHKEGHNISVELSSHKIGKGNTFLETAFKERWQRKLSTGQCAARALASLANSRRSRMAMRMNGIMPILARLMATSDLELLTPVVGIVKEFAKESVYRVSIYSERMVSDIVRAFQIDHPPLRKNAARAIFKAKWLSVAKCADDLIICDQIRKSGGLRPIVSILSSKPKFDIILPVTGAIWKLCLLTENVKQLQELNVIALLIPLMHTQPEKVVIHVVGAFSEIMKVKEYRTIFHKTGGLELLLQLQKRTKPLLLININNTIAQCAEDPECTEFIVKQDGVRLLWSVLKNPNPELQASATWAICPCIRTYGDSAELVRSFVGALDLLVGLLKSTNHQVLAGACAAIATIALDEENLAVMSDIKVVMYLSKLTCTNDELLQEHLADAIANSCAYADNREAFGKEDAVIPLVKYLKCKNPNVHRTTAKALHQLSQYVDNCITMHAAGCVPLLLRLTSSPDRVTQESAAKCMYNIRRLSMANQMAEDIKIKEK